MMQVCREGMPEWYAVHTKPHKEYAVQDFLVGRGLETYLPLLRVYRKRPSRAKGEKPFFSCYLFVHMDLDRVPLSSINWAPGVTRVVTFGGQPAVVPEEVIGWLKKRLAQIDGREYHRGLPLCPGDRLRVSKGPLKDMEAVFDQRLSSGDRARVFIEILGRLTACQIDLSCLERV